MPKTPATIAHFDAAGLLAAVAEQDFGLRITTNNPRRFREILYAAIRSGLGPRCYIYQSRRSPKGFLLLKEKLAVAGEPLPDPEAEDASA